MKTHSFRYGRLLESFEAGHVYAHPWEVTVDSGHVAFFQASFLDATPTYASTPYARDLGFRERPLAPIMLLNFALSFSVHDVSEQAIAHLAYLNVCFPAAAYAGDTLHAKSTVISVKPSNTGDRGVVHVHTRLFNQHNQVVCSFERKALVRAASGGGPLTNRPERPRESIPHESGKELAPLPSELKAPLRIADRKHGFGVFAEDLSPGDVIVHPWGRTVSESEHMQLTCLFRNTHPLHFDDLYCQTGGSFTSKRVVYGGLVFAWVAQLASRDLTGNALWDVSFDNGAHPSSVAAGDTLYAASKVISTADYDANHKLVTFRLVGVKNAKPEEMLDAGVELFTPELEKKDGRIRDKVFEIDRVVLLRNRQLSV